MLENEILKKYFGMEGRLNGGGRASFDFNLDHEPYYVVCKLVGKTIQLHERYARGMFEHTDTKDLSEEDIEALGHEGYEWNVEG